MAQKRSSISSANSSGHQDQRFPENADGYIAGQQFSFLFFILLDIRSWMKKKMKGKIVSDVTIPTSVLTVLSFLFFSSFKREKEENGKKTVNWRGIQSSLTILSSFKCWPGFKPTSWQANTYKRSGSVRRLMKFWKEDERRKPFLLVINWWLSYGLIFQNFIFLFNIFSFFFRSARNSSFINADH